MYNRPVTHAWKVMVSLGIFSGLPCLKSVTSNKDSFDKDYFTFLSMVKDESVYIHKIMTCS